MGEDGGEGWGRSRGIYKHRQSRDQEDGGGRGGVGEDGPRQSKAKINIQQALGLPHRLPARDGRSLWPCSPLEHGWKSKHAT